MVKNKIGYCAKLSHKFTCQNQKRA